MIKLFHKPKTLPKTKSIAMIREYFEKLLQPPSAPAGALGPGGGVDACEEIVRVARGSRVPLRAEIENEHYDQASFEIFLTIKFG